MLSLNENNRNDRPGFTVSDYVSGLSLHQGGPGLVNVEWVWVGWTLNPGD